MSHARMYKGIQSLQRGLKALEATIEKEVSSTDLAAILDVDRTTAFRLLRTLVAEGYVSQDPVTRTFRANPAKIFVLASKLSSSLNWLNVASDFLRELRDATSETANLGIMDGAEMVYVAQEVSRKEFSVRPMIGTRRPIHCSAIGKAMIAFLDEDELDGLITEVGLPRLTSHTITSPEVLKSHLGEVRARGYATDNQETLEGVRCIAAPIIGHTDMPFASIGVSGPVMRLTDDWIPGLGEVVREIAERLSNLLGAIDFTRPH